EALVHAHSIGIVHRDIKPGNMFVITGPDGAPLVKLVDFGIAKIPQPIETSELTMTSHMIGSPAYMSPEQLLNAKKVDARTDIWSLGIVLHRAIGGAPPFEAPTVPEVCARIIGMPASSLRRRRAEVPAELDAIISRCLAKERSARYSSVVEL